MALHRDIFWVGRQWAVTGCGMQAVDQKLKGKVDIDAIRLWEDGLLESVRAEPWLNIEDFEKALSVARKHFPEPARKAPPPEERVLALIEAISKEAAAEKVAYRKTGLKECSVEPPALPTFDMSIEGWPAKFVPPWRIRIKR